MAFKDDYDFELLKNEAEKLVIHEIEKQLKLEPDGYCRCNECVVDIAAMALNNIKPMYRFSLLGTIYASNAMNVQAYADSVKKAVVSAIKKIRSNPAHD